MTPRGTIKLAYDLARIDEPIRVGAAVLSRDEIVSDSSENDRHRLEPLADLALPATVERIPIRGDRLEGTVITQSGGPGGR
jgi:hypothetical protein